MGRGHLVAGVILLLGWPAMSAEGDILRDRHQTNELLSSWIEGATVRGAGEERIGTVRTLILDRESGRITAVVLSVGGVLGVGGKEVGVRWDRLEIDGDGRALSVDLSAGEAEKAPVFEFRQRHPRPPATPSTEPTSATELPVDR